MLQLLFKRFCGLAGCTPEEERQLKVGDVNAALDRLSGMDALADKAAVLTGLLLR